MSPDSPSVSPPFGFFLVLAALILPLTPFTARPFPLAFDGFVKLDPYCEILDKVWSIDDTDGSTFDISFVCCSRRSKASARVVGRGTVAIANLNKLEALKADRG